MFSENSLKWILVQKMAFRINLVLMSNIKDTTYLASKLHNYMNQNIKHLCIHLICMSCGPIVFQGTEIVGFLY
jgi:hypothetical protein